MNPKLAFVLGFLWTVIAFMMHNVVPWWLRIPIEVALVALIFMYFDNNKRVNS